MKSAFVFMVWACLSLGAVMPVQAQLQPPGATSDAPNEAPAVPDPLTEEAIRQLLSELDDSQVRALLLERLSAEAERRARALAAQDQRSLSEAVAQTAGALGAFLVDVIVKLPRIPGEIASAIATFDAARGDASYWRFLIALVASIAAGMLAAALITRALSPVKQWVAASSAETLLAQIKLLTVRLVSQTFRVLGFAFTAYAVNLLFRDQASADHETIAAIITAAGWIWFALIVARFLLAPENSRLRLCAVDDETARRMVRRIIVVAVIFNFGFGFTDWLNAFGSIFRDSWHGFWVNLAFHIAMIVSVWQTRAGIRSILIGDDADPSKAEEAFARSWPHVVILLLVAHWFVVETLVAVAYVVPGLFLSMAVSLVILMGFPFLDQAMRALIRDVIPAPPDDQPDLAAADRETRRGLIRIARVVGGILLILITLAVWNIDLIALAERGVGARLAGSVIDLMLIFAVAYGLLESVRIFTDRRIAAEQARLSADSNAAATGARLGTVLPLIKSVAQVAIVVVALLAVFGELGVNVLPLLASAGIVGIAIGFGAQALVKDVLSGIFFLIDDAFRKGEYIDIGNAIGTVEAISIRSMKLRHHDGLLYTIPFGEIGQIMNYSRDWGIMRLLLRVPYDTDLNRLGKLIDQLGEELVDDPDIGPKLTAMKAQGVVDTDDSALIYRVAFMTKALDQYAIRGEIYSRIRELFEKEGIRFASREVTVRITGDHREHPVDAAEGKAVAAATRRVVGGDEATVEPDRRD